MKMFTSVQVLLIILGLGQSECGVVQEYTEVSSSSSVPHHDHLRHAGRHHRLQDQVDTISIRQDTHDLLVQGLQEAVAEMKQLQRAQAKDAAVSPTDTGLQDLYQELRELRESLADSYHAKEDLNILRREMIQLRSHCGVGVDSDEFDKSDTSTEIIGGPRRREHARIKWLTETVTHLQDSVTDLQQGQKLLQDKDHHNQEVSVLVSGLSRDVGAVRSVASSGVARAELALEATRELRDDLREQHHQQADNTLVMAQLKTKMEMLSDDLADVFHVLPEGTMLKSYQDNEGKTDTVDDAATDNKDNGDDVEGGDSNTDDNAAQLLRNKKSILRKHEFDHIKNIWRDEVDKIESGFTKKITKLEHRITIQNEETQLGLGEVRSSSVELLSALEALETRVDKGLKEVRTEVAKMEFTVGKTEASQNYNSNIAKDHSIGDSLTLEGQIQTLRQNIDQLVFKVANTQTKLVEDHTYEEICKRNFTSLDVRITSLESHISHRKTRPNSKSSKANWPSLPIH